MIESTRRPIPHDHPVWAVFQQLTERGMSQLNLHDNDTIQYVTNLLIEFIPFENLYRVRNDSGQPVDYPFDILAQASQETSPGLRREYYRHLGDRMLFQLGLFPESLAYGRHTVSSGYYAETGRRSYTIVAEMEQPDTVVYRKLSEQFGQCVDSLHWVKLYINDPFYQYMFREFQVL